ncbi:hypothetical protein [Streptomyces altiplanensis]
MGQASGGFAEDDFGEGAAAVAMAARLTPTKEKAGRAAATDGVTWRRLFFP